MGKGLYVSEKPVLQLVLMITLGFFVTVIAVLMMNFVAVNLIRNVRGNTNTCVVHMKKDTWVGFIPFYLLVAIMFIGISVGSSTAVTTAALNAPIKRQHTIIIDAGHGGVDGGATSYSGILEKQLNLEIALRLLGSNNA